MPSRSGFGAMLAPMIVWALHFLSVYVLVGTGCERDWRQSYVAGLPILSYAVAVLGLLALLSLLLIALRALRSLRESPPVSSPPGVPSRTRFVSQTTLILSIVAAIAVLYATVPAFLLPTCE